jgi:UPF0755 protein
LRLFAKIFLIFIVLSISFTVFAWRDYTAPSLVAQEATVVIPRGIGFSKSIDLLAENGILSSPLLIKMIAYTDGDAHKIKAGEYLFTTSISAKEVLQMLVQGKVITHKITVAEGLNVREIVELLQAEPALEGGIPTNIEEGSLLPETYYFTFGDTRASVIVRMQEKMRIVAADLWERRGQNLPFTNLQQALTLASIVEKETGLADERPRVAAVFINRLRIGMKLQSDPTTAYGIEQITGKKLEQPLTLADLRTPTAYNTYTIEGLPPTPICNFGQAALEAVLHPLDNNELYFVATGIGGHNFATNLAEHDKNVKIYRAEIANQHQKE